MRISPVQNMRYSLNRAEYKSNNFSYLNNLIQDTVSFSSNPYKAKSPEALEDFALTPDEEGKLPAHKLGARELKMLNSAIKQTPYGGLILREMYLTPDMNGALPAHYMDADALIEMQNGLDNQDDLIEQIYLTQDAKGKTPAHGADSSALKVMFDFAGDNVEFLKELNLTRDDYGKIPAHIGTWNTDKLELILRTLKEKECFGTLKDVLLAKDDHEPEFTPVAYTDSEGLLTTFKILREISDEGSVPNEVMHKLRMAVLQGNAQGPHQPKIYDNKIFRFDDEGKAEAERILREHSQYSLPTWLQK